MPFLNLIAGLFLASAWAFPISRPNCLLQPSLENQANLLHKVAIIGRESRKEIPASLQSKFAATGTLTCGSKTATAQITGTKNVITTAGHTFFNKNCEPVFRGNECKFELLRGGRLQEYPVDIGSLKTGSCPHRDRREDWAVLKLSAPMADVTPYEIPDRDDLLVEGEQIMQVTGYSSNFSRRGEYPKAMESCRARKIYTVSTSPILHDCDTGSGSSGSAQFVVRDKKMIFAAMNVSEVKLNPEGGPFDEERLHNTSTPVSGAFLQAIRDQMK
jgi:hypothetical protein